MEAVPVSWRCLGPAVDAVQLQRGCGEKPPRAGEGSWDPEGAWGGSVWASQVPSLSWAAFSSRTYFLGGVPRPLLSPLRMPKILKKAVRVLVFTFLVRFWVFFMESRQTEVVSGWGGFVVFPQCDPRNRGDELCITNTGVRFSLCFVLTTLGTTSNKTKPCFQVELWPGC